MRLEGRQPTEIARILGREMNAVRGALYPEIHESLLRSSRRRKQKPASITWQKERRQVRDRERDKLRELARPEWRAAGGDPRALERFYRAFDCL
jgi:hypothetical protein